MLIESQGKLEKSQGKAREFRVKNLADTMYILVVSLSLFQKQEKNDNTNPAADPQFSEESVDALRKQKDQVRPLLHQNWHVIP